MKVASGKRKTQYEDENDNQNIVTGNESETNAIDMGLNTKIDELRKRILPVLLYCQAKKGDLELYREWDNREDRNKKYFYAYYSGLFCRILCLLEKLSEVTDKLLNECETLLEKYHWYDIQDEDIEKFVIGGSHACEVPEALEFIDGVDNVAWKDSGFGNGHDAVCLKMDHASWTFADVRGSVKLNQE